MNRSRCDACGTTDVEAVLQVRNPATGAALDLCRHHARQHKAALEASGWTSAVSLPPTAAPVAPPAEARAEFQILMLRNGAELREPDWEGMD